MAAKYSQPGEPRAGVVSLSERAIEAARFRRSDRLNRKHEFDRVLKARSVRVASAPFIALACPSSSGNARLGLIVAKRHCARAVDRNRIKRLARESFRARRGRLPSLDIVIQLVRAPGEANDRDALDEIWKQLERRQGHPL